MGIFNIFNKKSDNESAATVSLPVVEPSEAKVLLFFQQDRESPTLHPLYTLRYLHLLARL